MYISKSLIGKGAIGCVAIAVFGSFIAMGRIGNTKTCQDEYSSSSSWNKEAKICTVDGKVYNKIAIVYGNTANTPAPIITRDIRNQHLIASLAKSVPNPNGSDSTSIKLISTASSLKMNTFDIISSKANMPSDFIADINSNIDSINSTISKAPTGSGSTYLEAINKAGRALSNTDNSIIIVMGSGLSDGGALNFANENLDLLHRDAESVIDNFIANNPRSLGSLDGKRVIWYGLGEVTHPQTTLSDDEQNNLEAIYAGILEAEGAEVEFYTSDSHDAVKDNKYSVDTTSTKTCETVITFSNEELAFVENSDEFLDESAARLALQKIAEAATSSSEVRIEGFVAPRSQKHCNEEQDGLSQKRADKVKQELIKLNVDGSKIIAEGKGIFEPEISVCPNGKWREDVASTKRKVTIHMTSSICM